MASQKQSNVDKEDHEKKKGRQKIEIKPLQDESSRQVTFSKRRNGLFQKASELCVLGGANIGIVVFSPKGRPFCFGHPDVEDIFNCYLSGVENPTLKANTNFIWYRSAKTDDDGNNIPKLEEFNEKCEEALVKLEAEKQRGKGIDQEDKEEMGDRFWWDEPIDNMGVDELEAYVKALEELINNVAKKATSG